MAWFCHMRPIEWHFIYLHTLLMLLNYWKRHKNLSILSPLLLCRKRRDGDGKTSDIPLVIPNNVTNGVVNPAFPEGGSVLLLSPLGMCVLYCDVVINTASTASKCYYDLKCTPCLLQIKLTSIYLRGFWNDQTVY